MRTLFIPAILATGLIAAAFSFASEKHDLDDEHILDIVAAVNSMAIEASHFARSRSASPEVGAYAGQIADEHMNVSKLLAELAASLGLTPRHHPVSKELRMEAARHRALLENARDPEFDLLYIDQKIAFHQNVLDMIDNRLMPAAGSEELKALLYGLFAPFSDHLARAQEIQESLRGVADR